MAAIDLGTPVPRRTDRPGTADHPVRAPRRRGRGEGTRAALLVSPTLLVLALVVAYPILEAVRASLYGVRAIDPGTGFVTDAEPFVGLGNYTAILGESGARFRNALWNSTVLTVASVTAETVIGVLMALVMHSALRGRAWVRASILVPWAVPTAVSALLWRWVLDADGVANALLGTEVLWTAEGVPAKLAVVVADTWKTAPFVGLLVLAGLQMIPDEVREAARVDGAGPLRRFWSITLPLVKPALLAAVLFRLLDALRMFDLPYILIGAGKTSVETLSMLAQSEAANVRFGPASAYSVLLFLYVLTVAYAFIRLLGADVVGDAAERPRRSSRRSGGTGRQEVPA